MELFTNVKFDNSNKLYTFKTEDETLNKGDYVVVESAKGVELAKMMTCLRKTHNLSKDAIIKDVLRKATLEDLQSFELNKQDAKKALIVCQYKANELNLDMNFLMAEYTLDRLKITFTYIADERIDFRELLKVLAQHFKCRIELRQIGSRDKAKYIGGIGVCGRTLCCKTYINDFDMISINMAKNQFLALNVSKLSGACGKLKCCLKYEDDTYSEIRKQLPKLNSILEYEDDVYSLTSMNLISRSCKLENKERAIFVDLDDVLKNGKFKHNKNNLQEPLNEKTTEL